MSTDRTRALILGIDGGSLDLLQDGIELGLLPNLSRLLDSAAYGESTTTWPAHTATGWASFVSARHPGEHGIYQFFDTQDPDYGDRLLETPDFGCDTIWDWMNEQDLTVGLINVPMSHPPRELSGYELTWPLRKTLRFSHPPDLLGELARSGAGFKPDVAAMYQGEDNYLDLALANVKARLATARYQMSHYPADVVMLVITEVDRICHHYWHLADPTHPRHRSSNGHDREALSRIYAAVDEVFGELLECVNDETPVLLLSDHGFGQGRYEVALNTYLAEAGLLSVKTCDHDGSEADWYKSPDGRRTIDFSRTDAYMPVPGCYGVNVNLIGRQRNGRVSAADKHSILSNVADLALSLTAPDTGETVFAHALPADEAYPGPHVDKAPDLLLIPADEGILATPGLNESLFKSSGQTGMHRHKGMWAIRAPGLPPGRRGKTVNITDLGPILLSLMGIGVPHYAQRESARAFLPAGVQFKDHISKKRFLQMETRTSERLRDNKSTSQALAAMGYL